MYKRQDFGLGPGITVFVGANEAGKSSLQRAIQTLLFGFEPAVGSRHPYGASEHEELHVAGEFRWGETRSRVERRLGRGPSMRIWTTGSDAPSFERGNGPLAATEGVSARLFAETHCLTPDDALEFRRGPGEELDRLLMGDAAHGVPLRALMGALDQERTGLWRPDRRSKKTRAYAIDAALAKLAEESRGTRAVERGLTALEGEVTRRAGEARRLEKRVTELELELRALALIERVARSVRSAREFDGVRLDALGPEIPPAPGPILQALDEAEDAVAESRERLARPEPPLEDRDERALEIEGEIDAVTREEAEWDRQGQRAEESGERVRELLSAARSHWAAALADTSAQDQPVVDVAALREVAGLAAKWQLAARDGNAASGKSALGKRDLTICAVGVAAAAICAGFGFSWGSTPLAVLGSLAAVPFAWRAGAIAAGSRAAQDNAAARAARDAAAAIGMDPAVTLSPDVLLRSIERLEAANTARLGAEARAVTRREALGRIEAMESRWLALADELDLPVESAPAAPSALRRALQEARTRHTAWERDMAERRRAERDLEKAEAHLRDCSERFDSCSAALRAAVPGEPVPERAHRRLEEAWTQRERSIGALRELEGDPLMADIEGDPRLDVAREEGSFDGAEPRRVEMELGAAKIEAGRERDELVRAQERLARERPTRTASEIDSEVLGLREERAEVMERHDRLALLRALLEEGERRHRAAHQSSILGAASDLVAEVTGGRYGEIHYGGDEGGLSVRGPGGVRVPVDEPLSRGTREQIHLCLRIAAAMEIQGASGHGQLPLLLDEALVHWDQGRRRGMLRGLGKMVEQGAQVVMFTCHRHLADEVETLFPGSCVRI